ncbi:MAG: hypothetical protein ACTJGH_00360 [Peptoniphilaceae bacterium]
MKIKVNFVLETKEFIPLFVVRNKIKELESEDIRITNVDIKDYFRKYEKKRRF